MPFYSTFHVVQSDGLVVESHNTRAAADHAVEVLNAHEQRWAEAYAAGDPYAIKALRAGRPFSYHVREKGGLR